MKILSENVDCEYPQKIFEVGKIFNQEEKENLALAIAPANFTEVRQVLEYLSKMMNVKLEISESEKVPNYFIDGRTAEIKLLENSDNNKSNSSGEGGREKVIGFLGELHPKILRNWKIKMPVAIFEINLEEIFKKLE